MRNSYNTEATAVGPEPVVYNSMSTRTTTTSTPTGLTTRIEYGHVGNGGVGDGYAAPQGTMLNYGETVHVPTAAEMPASRY